MTINTSSTADSLQRFDAAWEELLLCQFHDVLPGSGIGMVRLSLPSAKPILMVGQIYEDAEAKYAAIQKSITAVLNEARSVLYKNSSTISADDPVTSAGTIFAINNIPNYMRQEIVAVPLKAHSELKACSAQLSHDGQTGYVFVDAARNGERSVGLPRGLYADVPHVSGGSTLNFRGLV